MTALHQTFKMRIIAAFMSQTYGEKSERAVHLYLSPVVCLRAEAECAVVPEPSLIAVPVDPARPPDAAKALWKRAVQLDLALKTR